MKSILSMSSKGDDSSSVNSEGSSTSYLGRLFGSSSQPRPSATAPEQWGKSAAAAAPEWGHHTIIPKYKKENRMLMKSPLPSPNAGVSVVRKKIVKPHISSADTESEDDDSQQQRRKREEAHVSRLVHMAKAQQKLMTAWFAASAGAESVSFPTLAPNAARRPSSSSSSRPRRAPPSRQLSNGSTISRTSTSSSHSSAGSTVTRGRSGSTSSAAKGPIDLDDDDQDEQQQQDNDDDDDDDAKSVSSQVSADSSRMRSFLGGILGSNASVASVTNLDLQSVMTGETPRISNISPRVDRVDLEVGKGDDNTTDGSYQTEVCEIGGVRFTKRRLICIATVSLLVLSAIAITAVVVAGLQGSGSDQENSLDSLFRPSAKVPATVPPAMAPSLLFDITSAPSTSEPTFAPTMQPSALFFGTLRPSSRPSFIPSYSPTQSPSDDPSVSPTNSPVPSTSPSVAPSTIFSTTLFTALDGSTTLVGEQIGEEFGHTTALSSDGMIMAVGARYFAVNNGTEERVGRVDVYQRFISDDDDAWIRIGTPLYGRNIQDQFGFAVALSKDGSVMAVSEPGYDGAVGDRSGSVRIFEWNDGEDSWEQVGQDIEGEAMASLFGVSVALSANGNRVVIGSPYFTSDGVPLRGRVRVYELGRSTNEWTSVGDALDGTSRLDWFGWSVDISADGKRIAVGAPRNRESGGYVRCYDQSGGSGWSQVGDDIVNDLLNVNSEDRFGMTVSLYYDRIAIGAPWKDLESSVINTGMVVMYEVSSQRGRSSTWNLVGSPLQGNTINGEMGASIKLQGDYLVVGSPGANGGSGIVTFHRLLNNLEWDTVTTPIATGVAQGDFGRSVSTNADSSTIAVGAPGSASTSGSVSVFVR